MTVAIVLVVYWVVPFAVSAAHGTAFNPSQLHALRALLGVPSLPDVPAFQGLAYTQDYIHLLFTVLIASGAGVAHFLIKSANEKLNLLRKERTPEIDNEALVKIYIKYLGWAFSPAVNIIALALSAMCVFFFARSAMLASSSSWWGHQTYGSAGIVFSGSVGLMVYWGTRATLALTSLSLMLGKLATYPIRFQPFHADGCNGLKPLGHVALLLWIFALLLAASIYVVFRHGYLGIENLPGMWLLAFVIGMCTPAIAVVPILRATLSVQASREQYLATLERQAELLFPFSPSEVAKHVDGIDKIKGIIEYKRALQDENVLPFRPRTIGTMVAATFIQYYLTLKQLFP